jgi:hypothetical protein
LPFEFYRATLVCGRRKKSEGTGGIKLLAAATHALHGEKFKPICDEGAEDFFNGKLGLLGLRVTRYLWLEV